MQAFIVPENTMDIIINKMNDLTCQSRTSVSYGNQCFTEIAGYETESDNDEYIEDNISASDDESMIEDDLNADEQKSDMLTHDDKTSSDAEDEDIEIEYIEPNNIPSNKRKAESDIDNRPWKK